MTVKRYRRKPERTTHADQYAAQYTPGQPLDDLLKVARMCDRDAKMAEVAFPSVTVLLVRYLHYPDDHPAEIRYETIEPGQYLAYSHDNDFLYDSDDGNWQQFYDLIGDA